MKKIWIFLTSIFTSTIIPLIVLANINYNNPIILPDPTPSWVLNMIERSKNKINIGYDKYFLINKIGDKENDPYLQKDWINLDLNQNIYIYLPEANNINRAAAAISINDSAKPMLDEAEPITWKKVNNTTYTNYTVITQDTSVNGIALMDNAKFNEIKTSSIADSWTDHEKDFFNEYASLPAKTIDPNKEDQNWWNANGWEKLLTDRQKILYDLWIHEEIIGMNVPLSLITENSFTLTTTEFDHTFRFQAMPKQTWINNNGKIIEILTPHWGFTLLIKDQEKKVFQTPQLIHLKNTYKEETIKDYLLNTTKYYSFNSQEKSKFKDDYIEDKKDNYLN